MSDKRTVLLSAPILSRSGYGHHARFVYDALKDREDIELFVRTTTWGKSSWLSEDNDWRQGVDKLIAKTAAHVRSGKKFDVSIQVTIPGEWEKIAGYNIGVTAGIETDKVSKQWLEKTYVVDKIIVTSEHSKKTFLDAVYETINPKTGEAVTLKANANVPIEVVAYPALPVAPDENFKLDLKYDFSYLSVLQWGPRKNLEQTVVGFLEALHNEPVNLILKLSGMNDSNVERENTKERIERFLEAQYKRFPERKCAIYLLFGHMTDAEMSALYQHSTMKAIVSLAHGEGFGLPLFEAAYYGLPVVCPLWSGQVDFLSAPTVDRKLHKTVMKSMITEIEYNIAPIGKEFAEPQWKNVIEPGMKWCYPEMASYKKALVDVYQAHSEKFGKAKKLRKHVLSAFEKVSTYDKMSNALLPALSAEEPTIQVV